MERINDAYDLIWCAIILVVVLNMLLFAVIGFRSSDLKEVHEQLSACTQQVDWWRQNFGVGRPEQ